MQDLHSNIERLDNNVKMLLRKLKESLQTNEILEKENNRLKLEIEKFEVAGDVESVEEMNSNITSGDSEEKYHKIKTDIKSYIKEIDECIQMIEN